MEMKKITLAPSKIPRVEKPEPPARSKKRQKGVILKKSTVSNKK